MMLRKKPYDALYSGFRWELPAVLNMAEQVCDGWAVTHPDKVAIIDLSHGTDAEPDTSGQRPMAAMP